MSVYEFKNTALTKLWDFMVSYNCKSQEQPSDILKAFQECDEALSELQDQCEHWKTMYGNACGDQDVLKESIRLLDTENRRLTAENKVWEKRCDGMRNRHLDTITTNDKTINLLRNIIAKRNEEMNQLRTENESLKKECERLTAENKGWEKRCDGMCNRHLDVVITDEKTIDQLREDNEALKRVIDDFVEKVIGKDNDIEKLDHMLQDLQKENDKLKKEYGYLKNSRDAWSSRAKDAEAERDELKKKLDLLQHAYNGACRDRNCKAEAVVKLEEKRDRLQEALDNIRAKLEEKVKRMDKITKDCDSYIELYDELSKDFDELCEEIKKLQEKNEELQQRLMETTDILEKINRDRNEWKRRALMTKLTSKVPDTKEEYTMTFTMDKADYNDLMKLLLNKSFGASPEYMRTFLKEFCEEHCLCNCLCSGCHLRECNSDCDFDNMSDEEIEKHYKMAISSK